MPPGRATRSGRDAGVAPLSPGGIGRSPASPSGRGQTRRRARLPWPRRVTTGAQRPPERRSRRPVPHGEQGERRQARPREHEGGDRPPWRDETAGQVVQVVGEGRPQLRGDSARRRPLRDHVCSKAYGDGGAPADLLFVIDRARCPRSSSPQPSWMVEKLGHLCRLMGVCVLLCPIRGRNEGGASEGVRRKMRSADEGALAEDSVAIGRIRAPTQKICNHFADIGMSDIGYSPTCDARPVRPWR